MNLAKIYEPDKYETDIYKLWEEANAFKPTGDGDPYSIIMPPPNANGSLHTGHALMTAVEDILVRYNRMQGKKTVWIPGEDHAGFETWVVYERNLEKQGKSRFDYSRDELYNQVFEFVNQNRGQMQTQQKRLGASCDWSAHTFTLDPNVVAVAYETFKKMWDDDLIYRGERIVNYCTKHQTSFADIEVTYRDEKSHLWHIKYPVKDSDDYLVVATTRPETMLGDTAVAVHPDDKRYKKYVGKDVQLPLSDRMIPIIADEMVDREFGTGAVKITPAHDPNDFEAGERHDLKRITVINHDGTISDNAPAKYRGLTIDKARKHIVKDLEEQGLLEKTEDISHSVGHCYKCGTVIEPLLMDQWFVRMEGLASRAIEAIEQGKINFYPQNKAKVLVNYLKNLKDWNISRQIPWGIPIPAFQNVDDDKDWIFSTDVDQETIKQDGKTYQRDSDTFDTWFSSGQWPYIVTEFNQHGDLKEFYPNSVMETGFDILFPWVSRMIMFGLYVTGDVPFKDVYLHGLVQDEHGQKMSKSKGNVVNPIELVDRYGSDALRLGLIANRSAGQSQAFSEATVIAGRNFCNKLWNMARFIEDKAGDGAESVKLQPQTPADHWVIEQINTASQAIGDLIDKYRFAEAYERLYHTIWDEVADWYIEASKAAPERSMLVWVLEACLRMSHPFAPFLTETIWQTLDWPSNDGLLIADKWLEPAEYDKAKSKDFQEIIKIVNEARRLIHQIGQSDIAIIYENDQLLADNALVIQHLSGVAYVKQDHSDHSLRLTQTSREAWFDLSDEQLDIYRKKLINSIHNQQDTIKKLKGRLANKSYVDNAPAELVAESREALDEAQGQLVMLDNELTNLEQTN